MVKLYKYLFLILFLIVLFPLTTSLDSLGVFKQGECVRITQVCSDATYINLSSVSYPNSSIIKSNIAMSSAGSGEFYYSDCNTSEIGRYDVRGISDGCENTFAMYYEVTPSGRAVSDTQIFATITLIFILLISIVSFHMVTKTINYEKWHSSIVRKYEHKNYIKVIISSLGYNLLKNKFIWYYLFVLPLILIVTDMTYTFGVNSMIETMKILLNVYYFGFILVGVFFFGKLQEWIVELMEEVKNLDWGVEK